MWARDASSLGTGGSGAYTYDAFNGIPYTLTVGPCSVMTASQVPASTADVSTVVAVTGAATGCPKPLYEFWLLPPGGAWRLAQAYSSSATFSWNTNGLKAGAYRFSVWAKDAATSSAYDSFSAFPYALTVTPCTALTSTSAPAGSASVGSLVTITGAATGCPNPLYEFWIHTPGGAWILAQAYSSDATFSWGTSGLAAGSYHVSVWVRDGSSGGTSGYGPYGWDAYSGFAYGLT